MRPMRNATLLMFWRLVGSFPIRASVDNAATLAVLFRIQWQLFPLLSSAHENQTQMRFLTWRADIDKG